MRHPVQSPCIEIDLRDRIALVKVPKAKASLLSKYSSLYFIGGEGQLKELWALGCSVTIFALGVFVDVSQRRRFNIINIRYTSTRENDQHFCDIVVINHQVDGVRSGRKKNKSQQSLNFTEVYKKPLGPGRR